MFHRFSRALLASLVLVIASASSSPQNRRIRGVNLGGWLVLEKWIKPSLFEGPAQNAEDEFNFCTSFGKEEASRRLSEHWDTWVTYDDIKTLAEAGITHLRVPVPYWIFGDIQGDEPWVTGNIPGTEGSSLYYLTRVTQWAEENKMEIWFDLHTAPGSQNGYDNSGQKGQALWDTDPKNVQRSVDVLGQLAKHFADEGLEETMTGIGLLNEPFWVVDIMLAYYADAFKIVRTYLPDVNIFIGDSFGPRRFADVWTTGGPEGWDDPDSDFYKNKDDTKALPFHRQLTSTGLRGQEHPTNNQYKRRIAKDDTTPKFTFDELERKLENVEFEEDDHQGSYHKSKGSVLLDTHVYHMYNDALRMYPAARQIGHICLWDEVNINTCCWEDYEAGKPTKLKRMIGEWTAAFDQVTGNTELEAREFTGTMHNMTEQREEFLKHFVYAQMAEFEKKANLAPDAQWHWLQIEGWFFWNFKMELETYREWDYLKGLERGWIPKLPSFAEDDRVAEDIFGSCEDQRQWALDQGDKMKGVVDPYPPKEDYLDVFEDPDTAPLDDDMRHPPPLEEDEDAQEEEVEIGDDKVEEQISQEEDDDNEVAEQILQDKDDDNEVKDQVPQDEDNDNEVEGHITQEDDDSKEGDQIPQEEEDDSLLVTDEEGAASFSFNPIWIVGSAVACIIVFTLRWSRGEKYEAVHGTDTQPLKSEISITDLNGYQNA